MRRLSSLQVLLRLPQTMPNGGDAGSDVPPEDPAERSDSGITVSVEVTSPAELPGAAAKSAAKAAATKLSSSEDSSSDEAAGDKVKCPRCWKQVAAAGLEVHQKLSRDCLAWQFWNKTSKHLRNWTQRVKQANARKKQVEGEWQRAHVEAVRPKKERTEKKDRKEKDRKDKKRSRDRTRRGREHHRDAEKDARRRRRRAETPREKEKARRRRRVEPPSMKSVERSVAPERSAVSAEEMQRRILQATANSLQMISAPTLSPVAVPAPTVHAPQVTMPAPTMPGSMPPTTIAPMVSPKPVAPLSGEQLRQLLLLLAAVRDP